MWNKWLFLLSLNKQFLDDIENDTCQSCLEKDTYGLLVGTYFYNIRVRFFFKVIFKLFYVTDLYEFIYFLIFYCLEKIQVPYHKDLNFQLFSQKIFNFNLYM